MSKVVVISTSLRPYSNRHLFCGGVTAPGDITGNAKLEKAYELGKSV